MSKSWLGRAGVPPFLYQRSLQTSRDGFAMDVNAYLLFQGENKPLKIFHAYF